MLIGGYCLPYASAWAANLTLAIKDGAYSALKESWLEGMDLKDPVTSSLKWAEESNALICTTVLPEGVEGVKGKELSGVYFETAVPVVQLQVAKAGYR